jgi:hypothetical protein
MINRGANVGIAVSIVAGALLATRPAPMAQSLSYSSGQNVAPAYEGWEQAADGTKYFLFGYMNRNWEEEIDVPPGPDNGFNVGGADQGQPTHFLPRRNRFVFKVRVPNGFTEKDELVWTLVTHGKTESAYASLRPDYLVDDVVKASETGALGAGTSSPEVRANKPPVVTLDGPKTRTVKVGEPLTLAMTVTDDGVPKPRSAQRRALEGRGRGGAAGRGATAADSAAADSAAPNGAASAARRNPALVPPSRVTVGKAVGLHLSWFVYRGSGAVTFTPAQVKPWEDTRAGANSPWAPLWTPPTLPADGRIVAQATFAEPGTYVLRGLADDGALTSGQDVTVTVSR